MRSSAGRTILLASAMAGAILAATSGAFAQTSVADFYKGKTITIFTGFAAGGGYDAYARLLSRHMGKRIPGAPSILVKNMFGAGGELAAAFVANVAPKDGTSIAGVAASQPLARIFIPKNKRAYEPARQQYLGSASADTYVCLVRKDAPVQTVEDMFKKELILGSGARRAGTLSFIPTMEQTLLGTRIKIIIGYKGSRGILAAMEKKELHGLCGMNLSSVTSRYAHHLRSDGMARILVQESAEGDPALNAAKVPRMYDLAKTDKQRKIMRAIYAQGKFARPFFLPEGTPPDRIATLRKAFFAALQDKDLLADAKKLKLRFAPVSGSAIQAIVAEIAREPDSFIDEVKAAIKLN